MLDGIGVTPRLIEQGLICPSWQIRWHPQGDRAVFDLSVLADVTAHPYRLQVEQWKLSLLLRELVDAAPTAEIRFNARATGVELAEDGAVVTVETPEGPRQLRAKYVVGCDGARSIVRQSLGLSFRGNHLSGNHDPGDDDVSLRGAPRRLVQRHLLLEGTRAIQPAACSWPLAHLDLSARGCSDRGANDAGGDAGERPGYRQPERSLRHRRAASPIGSTCASRHVFAAVAR